MPNEYDKERQHKLIELVRQAISQDEALREKYEIGNKFRFVRDRLHALLEHLEKDFAAAEAKAKKQAKKSDLTEDEVLVYVYIYNVHGASLPSWQKLLIPKVFYEFSVNRPIYAEKSHIESLLKLKSNKTQHAYLTIAIKRVDITKPVSDMSPKDAAGNPVIKIKEGTLHIEKLITFTHHGHEYILDENGQIVKKKS